MGLVATAALLFSLGVGGADHRFAVRYAPDLLEHIAESRGLPALPCFFAHPEMPIGTRAYIRGVRTGHGEWCVQGDTSQPWDRQRHIRLRRVELSYDAALRICGVRWEGAARECEVLFWVLPDRVGA